MASSDLLMKLTWLFRHYSFLLVGTEIGALHILTCLKQLNGMNVYFLSQYCSEMDGWELFSCPETFIYAFLLLPNHSISILSFPSSFCLFVYSFSISLTSTVISLVLKFHVVYCRLTSSFVSALGRFRLKRDATNCKLLTRHFKQVNWGKVMFQKPKTFN